MTQPNDLLDLNQLYAAIEGYEKEIKERASLLDRLTSSELSRIAEYESVLREAEKSGYRLVPDQDALLAAYDQLSAADKMSDTFRAEVTGLQDKLKTLRQLADQHYFTQNTAEQTRYTDLLKQIEPLFTDLENFYSTLDKASAASSAADLDGFKKLLAGIRTRINTAAKEFPVVKNVLDMYADMCQMRMRQVLAWNSLYTRIKSALDELDQPLQRVSEKAATIDGNEHAPLEQLVDEIASIYAVISPEKFYHLGGALEYTLDTVPNKSLEKEFDALNIRLKQQYETLNRVRTSLRKLEARRDDLLRGEAVKKEVAPLNARVDKVETGLKDLYHKGAPDEKSVGRVPALQQRVRILIFALIGVGALAAIALIAGIIGLSKPEPIEPPAALSTEELETLIWQQLGTRSAHETSTATALFGPKATQAARDLGIAVAALMNQTPSAPTPLTSDDVAAIVANILAQTPSVTPSLLPTTTPPPTATATSTPETPTVTPSPSQTVLPAQSLLVGTNTDVPDSTPETTPETTPEITPETTPEITPELAATDEPFTLLISVATNYRPRPNMGLDPIGSITPGTTITVVGQAYGADGEIYLRIQLTDTDPARYYMLRSVLTLAPDQIAELDRRFPSEPYQ